VLTSISILIRGRKTLKSDRENQGRRLRKAIRNIKRKPIIKYIKTKCKNIIKYIIQWPLKMIKDR